MDTNTPHIGRVAEDRTDWVSKARCLHSIDPDELFVRGKAQTKAAVICRNCPVMTECLADALDNEVEFGVLGWHDRTAAAGVAQAHPEGGLWSAHWTGRRPSM